MSKKETLPPFLAPTRRQETLEKNLYVSCQDDHQAKPRKNEI